MHETSPRYGRAASSRAMVGASGSPRSSLSWQRMMQAWLTSGSSLRGRSAQARQVLHEVLDIVVAERLRRDRHRAIEIGRRLRLERAEEAEQILGILARQSRHLLLAREVWPVARR